MRRPQNADTHALKRYRLLQNISPVCSSFVLVIAPDIHLESESEKRAKNVDFHTDKKYPDTTNTFSLFLDQFLETDLRPIDCSATSSRLLGAHKEGAVAPHPVTGLVLQVRDAEKIPQALGFESLDPFVSQQDTVLGSHPQPERRMEATRDLYNLNLLAKLMALVVNFFKVKYNTETYRGC